MNIKRIKGIKKKKRRPLKRRRKKNEMYCKEKIHFGKKKEWTEQQRMEERTEEKKLGRKKLENCESCR